MILTQVMPPGNDGRVYRRYSLLTRWLVFLIDERRSPLFPLDLGGF
jgi:hypothetical protein